MKKLLRPVLLHCVLPLLAGWLIYFILRPDVLAVRSFVQRTPLVDLHTASWPLRLLAYSGPDFCWAWSLTAALFLWHSTRSGKIPGLPWIVFAVVAGSEILQLLIRSGFYFDFADLAATILAFVLSGLLTTASHEKN